MDGFPQAYCHYLLAGSTVSQEDKHGFYSGLEREVLLSKKSGKRSVEYKLEKLNFKATSEQVDEVLKKVKELGVKKKGLINDDEFTSIVKEVLKQ